MEATNDLTKITVELQNDNKRLFSCMKNLSGKIDEINYNIGELKKENQMLRNKLKASETKDNSIDNVYVLADSLGLTTKYSSTKNHVLH